MQVLFLGTSAGWPLPRLNCQCRICTSSDPKDKRWRPSILINKKILIDAGPDFYHEYQKYQTELKNLKYIFLTHNHPDHYFGLWDVAKIYQKKDIKIFLSEKNKSELNKRINDLTFKLLLRQAETFKTGKKIVLDSKNSVTPFLVEHSTNTETYGFIIFKTSGIKKMSYLPDFKSIPKASFKYLKKIQVAIFDGSTFAPVGGSRFGHLAMKETIKLAKKLKIKTVYFTHIGHGLKMSPHVILEQKIQKIGGSNFYLAYDGLKLTV